MSHRADRLEIDAWLHEGVLLERYRYAPDRAGTTAPHVHDGYQCCLSVDFPGVYRYRGGSVPVPPGSLTVLHPGEPHSCWDPHDRPTFARYLVAYFPPAAVAAAASAVTARVGAEPFFTEPVLRESELIGRFAGMHRAASEGRAALELDERLLDFLTRLTARVGPNVAACRVGPRTGEPHAIATAREYLHSHYAERVRLDELASLVHLSPFHLSRAFRATVGVPPHRYQLLVRIELAKRLLADGERVSEVAAATGFADHSHFTRRFREMVGVTPSRYRAERRPGAS